jgi:hypothetical protein
MNEPTHKRSWNHGPHLLLTAAVASTALLSADFARGTSPNEPAVQSGGDAPHGALPMDKQRTAVAALQTGKLSGAAPTGVDPTYWATLSHADNAPGDARLALGLKLYFDPKLSKDGTVA